MRTILDVKRRLAAARCPYPVSLMDDLEEAYAEIERLRATVEGLETSKEIDIECHVQSCLDYQTQIQALKDERDQLRMELEGTRYALKVIQMGEWACTFDEKGLEVWTTRRINPGRIAREALVLGQEGEGNQ